MKKIFLFIIALSSFSAIMAQPSAEITRDAQGQKIVKGFLTKKELATDTAFGWFTKNAKAFTINADVVKQYAANKDSVNIIVFGGTWCEDTQHLLPNFYATTDAAGFPESRITLIGVDRNKKTVHNLSEAFGITNVPTFIVMKHGKEIGRVVEYGKIGAPEKEVAQMITNAINK